MSLEDTLAPATPAASTPLAPSNDAPAVAPEAPAADAPDDGGDISDELAKVWQKAQGPERDEAGRFKGTEKPEKVSAEGEQPEAKEEAAASEPEKPAAPAVEPPRAWTAEQKAKWSTLPPDMQSHIAAREQELHESKSQLGRMEAEYKPLRDTLEQYNFYLSQVAGGNVAGYMQRLLAASHALDTNPAQTIKELANAYGVDLGEIYDPLETPPDPRVAQLERQLAAYQSQLQQLDQSRAASQEAATAAEIERTLSDFYNKHPDAREISEAEFAAQIQAVKVMEPNLDHAATLAKAYERAAWSSEATRQKRLEALQKEAEAQRIAAAKEAAAKAKKAAGVNVQGSPNPNSEPDDPTDQLRAIWRKRHAA